MTEKAKQQYPDNEFVADENVFIEGDDHPNCEGEPCANVAGEEVAEAEQTAKMAVDSSEWKDKYTRLSAEFDNYRKRTLKEKMDLVSSASEDVIKSLLPVLDDFDRAIQAIEKAGGDDSLLQGVVLIANKLKDTLRSKGLVEIDAMGKVLDTDLHEAVAQVPGQKSNRGKVIDVVQRGYKLGDKVIRYAKVVVGE